MDALCDPRAFLSAQEKRTEQLKALGIEENDISGDVIQSKGGDGKGDAKGGAGGKKQEEKKGKLIRIQMMSMYFRRQNVVHYKILFYYRGICFTPGHRGKSERGQGLCKIRQKVHQRI